MGIHLEKAWRPVNLESEDALFHDILSLCLSLSRFAFGQRCLCGSIDDILLAKLAFESFSSLFPDGLGFRSCRLDVHLRYIWLM